VLEDAAVKTFWESARAELDRVPIDARLEELSPSEPLIVDAYVKTRTISEISLSSLGGIRIRGWYLVPAGVPPQGGWPVIMELPPYREIVSLPLHLALHGFATLSLFPRSQSISRKEWQIDLETKVTYNITDRDKYYYRGAYMDCIRGLDFLCSRPEVNQNRIGTWGFSAGGGLSLVTAGLDRRVKAAVAGIPWPCDFRRGSEAKTFPFVHVKNYLERHPENRQAVMTTLDYFDVVNLVDAIACPVLIGGAIQDEMHPIDSTFAAFKKIPSKKSIIVYPDLNHEYKSDFTLSGLNWMTRHL